MTTAQIKELIEVGSSLKDIASSYTEIASIKLRKIRSSVERNRQFYDELTRVYALINKIAATKKIIPAPKPKKVISVLLTSNYRFYGNINNQLVQHFIVTNTKMASDKLVVGKTGRDYLKGIHYFHAYNPVIFKNDMPDDNELKSLVKVLQEYKQVLVFYPQFKSVLVQVPTVKDITQTQLLSLQEQSKPDQTDISFIFNQKEFQTSFIFEPEIMKMLDFFDNQIKILLLEQTILESELARTASRLIAMDQAQSKAKDFIGNNKKALGQLRKSTYNARLLETLATMSKWRKEKNA